MSPLRSEDADTTSSLPSTSLRASVSLRILRSVSACALPRPSATASAKFANTTVNQSQTATPSVNQGGIAPFGCVMTSRMKTSVVSTLPISTTNMTGFFQTCCGASFLKLSLAAAFRIAGSKSEISFVRAMSVDLSGAAGEVLDDRAERVGGEERQRTDDDDHRDEQACEDPAIGREGTQSRRDRFLAHHRAGNCERGHDHREASEEHGDAHRDVVPTVAAQAGERRAVVAGAAGKRIDDLGQAVGPVVAGRREPVFGDAGPGGEAENDEWEDEDVEHRELDLA